MDEYVAFKKEIDPFEIKTVREEIEEDGDATGRHKKKSSRVTEKRVKEVRPIEEWLTEVQEQMRDSLRSNVTASTKDALATPKPKWIFAWAQQTVLVIDQIDWTAKVEKAITAPQEDALRLAFKREEAKLAELVDLIKEPNRSKVDMRTLETLIVTDVHAMDVT